MRQYPQLEFDLALLRSNADAVISRCRGMGIRVCGVVKGVDGLPEAARVLRAAGAEELGTSRLEQVAKCRAAGVPGPWLLIRIPGLTELPDVVALCETSLQSEWPTLLALEEECLRQNKTHRVIVMTDLGDLREGFWDKKELVDVCERVERDLPHVQLAGIGVNLTCYGSTKPTPEKMNELVGLARQVEQRIGRKLEIVSGGATSSFTLVHWGTMPAGVNHLRIGEAILLGKDLQVDWGRALLALGRADVGELESLIPREPGMTVIGGSSDHCIVDVEDCPRRLQVGDIVEFSLCYSHMLYATARSDMRIIFKNQSAQEE